VRFREIVTAGLGSHGEGALRRYLPRPGQRVLDIGCGFGDTTQRIAGLVGTAGEAVGVDTAPRFIQDAIREAGEAGVTNARFLVCDVEESLSGERGSTGPRRSSSRSSSGPPSTTSRRDRAAHLHGRVAAALREGLAELAGPDGVRASASTWIVHARVAAAG
jgi:SAM-dependent methyltransferase